jgi:Protein of unknown function DUF262
MKTTQEKEVAELQIIEERVPVNYDTREYPVEVLIDKYQKEEFVIPPYQRNFVWEKDIEKMSKFIESLLLDLPIPYLFFADDLDSGKLEIVDGSQRIRTINKFKLNEFALNGLEVLDQLNGFKYDDLLESRQRRFLRKTLRSIELTEKASANVRRDLFGRINTKPYDLTPMEIRKGVYEGKFYDFLNECSQINLFNELCPISEDRKKRGEAQELVLRFFAYTDNYQSFIHRVDDFLDDYISDKHTNGFDKINMELQFNGMLAFVNSNFPNGFKKAQSHNTTPRVRFEAISVGVALALRENQNLIPSNVAIWLNSADFKEHTTSDAANSKVKVIGRIEFVKNKLLY